MSRGFTSHTFAPVKTLDMFNILTVYLIVNTEVKSLFFCPYAADVAVYWAENK